MPAAASLSRRLPLADDAPGSETDMNLHFPNPSRSFDETRNRVRFWGYDKSIEVSFFVEKDAMHLLDASLTDGVEAAFLKAFDAARQRIETAAEKAYRRDSNRSHNVSLFAADFH
jgi:hypothetical protein